MYFFKGIYWDGWYPPPTMIESRRKMLKDEHSSLKTTFSVDCGGPVPKNVTHCTKLDGYCLFNIKEDPCEFNDLSKVHPDILQALLTRLDEYKSTMVPPRNNMTIDPLANPKLHNGVWVPWIKLN